MQKDDLVFDADGPPAGEQVTGRGRTSVFFWRRGGVLFLRLIVYLPGLAVWLSGCVLAMRVRVEGIPGRCGTGGAQASTRWQVWTPTD